MCYLREHLVGGAAICEPASEPRAILPAGLQTRFHRPDTHLNNTLSEPARRLEKVTNVGL